MGGIFILFFMIASFGLCWVFTQVTNIVNNWTSIKEYTNAYSNYEYSGTAVSGFVDVTEIDPNDIPVPAKYKWRCVNAANIYGEWKWYQLSKSGLISDSSANPFTFGSFEDCVLSLFENNTTKNQMDPCTSWKYSSLCTMKNAL